MNMTELEFELEAASLEQIVGCISMYCPRRIDMRDIAFKAPEIINAQVGMDIHAPQWTGTMRVLLWLAGFRDDREKLNKLSAPRLLNLGCDVIEYYREKCQ